VSPEKERVILELMKKSEKLKRKLQEEKKFERFLQCLLVLSWAITVVLVLMLLFKLNCN